MSSESGTPEHFGSMHHNLLNDPEFTEEINKKMQIPKRIRVNGRVDDDRMMNGYDNGYNYETISMEVPERIIVIGNDRTIGTKTLPRRLMVDPDELQSPPYSADSAETVRVITPPRTITLDRYQYPNVIDSEENITNETLPVVKPRTRLIGNDTLNRSTDFNISNYNGVGGELTVNEEVLHLRKQMARLNRRVLAVEHVLNQRTQRERIIYGIGLGYFILKSIIWLSRP